SPDGNPVRASCGLVLTAEGRLSATADPADLLIPGGEGVDRLLLDQAVLASVAAKAAIGTNPLISICSGALVLAAAGVLHGQTATTHWSRKVEADRYSDVDWDIDSIHVLSDRIFTSAGVTTGIDLALAIIRMDCGNAAALDVARELVVQLRRTGGQSQYALHLAGQFTSNESLSRLIEAVVTRPDRPWTAEDLAQDSGMNGRTLARHFRRHLNSSPAQFVEKVRVDHARALVADNLPLKTVAVESGFGDLQRMRRAFQRRFGVNVGEYLSVFGET
ncbi:MAG: AraC family transcriptional regulator, partial [Cypionkella sp.]|uniref:GlxA family transcriptional regulator n=1 Tax=Cypionkella sp. TaxID=2811411 RepID=UPI002634CEF1